MADEEKPVMRRSLPKLGDEDFMPNFTPEALLELARKGRADPDNPYRNTKALSLKDIQARGEAIYRARIARPDGKSN